MYTVPPYLNCTVPQLPEAPFSYFCILYFVAKLQTFLYLYLVIYIFRYIQSCTSSTISCAHFFVISRLPRPRNRLWNPNCNDVSTWAKLTKTVWSWQLKNGYFFGGGAWNAVIIKSANVGQGNVVLYLWNLKVCRATAKQQQHRRWCLVDLVWVATNPLIWWSPWSLLACTPSHPCFHKCTECFAFLLFTAWPTWYFFCICWVA